MSQRCRDCGETKPASESGWAGVAFAAGSLTSAILGWLGAPTEVVVAAGLFVSSVTRFVGGALLPSPA